MGFSPHYLGVAGRQNHPPPLHGLAQGLGQTGNDGLLLNIQQLRLSRMRHAAAAAEALAPPLPVAAPLAARATLHRDV